MSFDEEFRSRELLALSVETIVMSVIEVVASDADVFALTSSELVIEDVEILFRAN